MVSGGHVSPWGSEQPHEGNHFLVGLSKVLSVLLKELFCLKLPSRSRLFLLAQWGFTILLWVFVKLDTSHLHFLTCQLTSRCFDLFGLFLVFTSSSRILHTTSAVKGFACHLPKEHIAPGRHGSFWTHISLALYVIFGAPSRT